MAKAKVKVEPLTLDNVLNREQADKVRAAYKRGQRTIEIEGRSFSIALTSERKSFRVVGEDRHQNESWLLLRPTNGDLVPFISLELSDGGNARSYKAKS
jgi:hypothetical protein